MLHFLTMADNRGPVRRYLRWWGGALRGRVRLIPYEAISDPARLAPGTYIFGDIERLSAEGLSKARAIGTALAARKASDFRILNDPRQVLGRHALLRLLYRSKTNRFNVYRLGESREGMRFPVFVRSERQHTGPLSPLLHDAAALDAAIGDVVAKGTEPGDVLIVEFFDTRRDDGYRKYSVMKLGDRLLAMHIFFDESWIVKATTHWPPERVAADNAFMRDNPHAAELAAIFDLARIDFGRIDYAVKDGRLAVWEINTVPTILLHRSHYGADRLGEKKVFARRFNAALAALDPGRTGFVDRLQSLADLYLPRRKVW